MPSGATFVNGTSKQTIQERVKDLLAKFAKLLLVCTALAPILMTLAVIRWVRGDLWPGGALYFGVAVGLFILCGLILRAAKKMLEQVPVDLREVRTADAQIVGFVIAYLLPLVNANTDQVEWRVLGFVLLLFLFVVWSTHSYHFNPLLALLGYHFYEVTDASNVSYVLITRRSLRNTVTVKKVIQLTEYMLLDGETKANA